MKKRMRTVALLLTAVMSVTALTGCGGTEQEDVGSKESVSQQEKDTDSAESEEGLEPITLTVGINGGNEVTDGIHTEEYPALQALEDATGVTLDFVKYDDEKFGVLAAGGELPDIVCLVESYTNTLIESGQIIRLNELLDEYGQNIKERIPDVLNKFKEVSEDGESIYYLSVNVANLGTVPAFNGFVGFKTRYDVYKAIGSPEINSEDDYLEVLKQMQDYQREVTGNDNIYALSAFADAGTFPYLIAYPFSHGYMNDGIAVFDMATGEYNYNYTKDSVFMDGIRFFNKAYRMGIFDPDGFTQKWEQYNAKVGNGECLVNIAFAEPDRDVCGEDAICTVLPGTGMPYISGVYTTPYPFGTNQHHARAISSNCKYPERAMQVLNWLDSTEGSRTLVNGIQGVDWDYVDGEPQFIGEALEAANNGTLDKYNKERGIVDLSPYLISGPNITLDDGYPVSIKNSESYIGNFTTEAAKAFAQDFDASFTYPGQAYDMWVKEGVVETDKTEKGMKINGLRKSVSDECNSTIGELDNYFISNVSKLIMADSDEVFEQELDNILQTMDEMGSQDCVEEYKSLVAEATEAYEKIFEE